MSRAKNKTSICYTCFPVSYCIYSMTFWLSRVDGVDNCQFLVKMSILNFVKCGVVEYIHFRQTFELE